MFVEEITPSPHTHEVATIKKRNKKSYGENKCWQGCGETGAPVHCRWERRLIQPLWETVQVPQKLKNTAAT